MARLTGKRIAVLCTDGVEEVELTRPWEALEEEGAEPELISLKEGHIQAVRHMEKGDRFPVDATIAEVHAGDYDGLLVPGGVVSPDRLRTDVRAVRFVKEFFLQGKPVASICHGPWMLVEADVVAGRRLTSWPSLKTDIRNAGGTWVDEKVVRDGSVVTSRKPGDLDVFCPAVIDLFAAGASPGAWQADEDRVNEASEESFPASDPPAYGF